VIRDLAAGADGGGQGGRPMQIAIHATDAKSVRRLLQDNASVLVDVLRSELANQGWPR